MTTITLPTPTITARERGFYVNYEISRVEQSDGSYTSQVVQVAINHFKSKGYSATVYRVTMAQDADSPFTSTKYDPMKGVRFGSESAPRYSAKGLNAFMQKTIADFEVAVGFMPNIQAQFANPSEEQS